MKSIRLNKNQRLFISEPKESPFDIENNTLLYYSNDIAHPQKEHSKYIEDITNKNWKKFTHFRQKFTECTTRKILQNMI